MEIAQSLKHKTFASLQIRNYRLYFFGQAVSVSGTWMQTVALGWLVLQISGSGVQLGSVVALQFVPMFFLGAWGGVIADRFEKRRMIIFAQSAFALLAVVLSILVFTGVTQLWMLYVFALCYGLVRVIDEPTRHSFVSEMVDSGHMKNAVTLNSTVNNLARAIGPTIGGILILSVGIAFCFLINALSYLAVIWMLFLMKESELHRLPSGEKKSAGLKEGFTYAWANPVIRDTLIMSAIVGTFAYEWQVSLPLLAQRTFHGDASSYSSLMSAFGAGAVIGGLLAASRHVIVPSRLIGYTFLFGASIVATAFMPTLGLAIFGMMVVGFFSINFASLANTMLQLESVHEMRGRVIALWTVALMGSTTIGAPIIGFIGEHMGARWGLAAGGISAFVAAGIAAYPLLARDKLQVVSEAEEMESESLLSNLK